MQRNGDMQHQQLSAFQLRCYLAGGIKPNVTQHPSAARGRENGAPQNKAFLFPLQ